MQTQYVAKFIDAQFGYQGKSVLTDLNLTIAPGEAVALIGPNGSGKTTLLRGILHSAQNLGGSMEINASNIGYVPQSANLDLTFPVTAKKVVEMGVYAHVRSFGRLPKKYQQKIHEVLLDVGMAEFSDKHFGSLSGGQRQRILLARALVSDPQLILLDEPFNGLDEQNRRKLLEIIEQVKANRVSVIASTHDLSLARKTCDCALLLAGKQIAYGPVEQVLNSETVAFVYGDTREGESCLSK